MYRDKRFLVLEIEDELVKAAIIKNSRGSIFVKDISRFSKDKKEIDSGIRKLQAYKRHRKNTIVLIPPKKAMIRYLELPSSDRAELKDMINFQLPRYLPYNLGDIIFDFRIVQETKEGYARVMVVCIQKELFKEILEIIPYLEDSLYGVFLCGETEENLLQFSDVEALIDISSEEVILSIFDPLGVLFMRSLDNSFFIHEKGWPKGLEEMERSFIAFNREFSEKKIESIGITGARAYTNGFYNFLKEHSSCAIALYNPFDRVQCQEHIKEKFNDLSFQAVMGAGASPEKGYMNLIPAEFLSKKGKQLRIRDRLYTLLLGIFIIFQLFFIVYKEMDKKRMYLNYLTAEIEKTKSKARAIEDKEKKASLIKGQLDAGGFSLDILREVYRIISPNLSINILIFEKNNSLRIRGTAKTMAEVFTLIPQLEKSPYFDKVISEGTKIRKLKGEAVADFQIQALLKKGRD